MGKITVTSILWENPQPDGPLQVMVAYKQKTLIINPFGFIIVATGVWVGADGVFFFPVVINGLDLTKEYTVRVTSLCGGYIAYQDFIYQPPAAFSLGFTIGFDS